MPFVDLAPADLGTRFDRPEGFTVTPGADDVNHGSEAVSAPGSWLPSAGFMSAAGELATSLTNPARAASNIIAAAQSPVTQAAFRQDNTIGAWLASGTSYDPNFREEGFNPWDAIKGTKYQPYWSSFIDVHSTPAADAMKRKIDRELDDRRTLEAAPWYQSVPAQMLAGVLDWPSLLPGGAFVRGAKGGYSLARSALSVAGAAGASSLAQEAALQSLTETRTAGESALNIGASVLLGGLLGAGGAKLLSAAEWKAGVEAIERGAPAGPEVQAPSEVAGGPSSAGAAAVRPATLEENTILGGAAETLAEATRRLNPNLRLNTSPSAATREVAGNLTEFSAYLRKNAEGVASAQSAETAMTEWRGNLARALSATDTGWIDYWKAGGPLKRNEFAEEVGRAMRRGDEHEDPRIAAVAKAWRKEVFDPLKQAAIETGQLPEDVAVTTADSYFSRMWNRGKLVSREAEFKDIVRGWVEEQLPEWAAAYDRGVERRLNPLRQEIEDLEMAKLRRAEEARQRAAGEVDPGEFTEADIRAALRIVRSGAPKPKGVQTLTQFVHQAGGLVDYSGELAHMGISNKTRPGFVRNVRRTGQNKGGWAFADMARHAWENGFFPGHVERPTVREFLDALSDDFNKLRAVVRDGDREAYRLNELVDQLDADLARIGIHEARDARFSTSDEVKGMVQRINAARDAEDARKIDLLRRTLAEREAAARSEREARFLGEPKQLGGDIARQVYDSLTGRANDGVRPEFVTITARGPLKERTFNIPDALVEDFLEHNVELVGRRYARVMGADVELARKFGSPDMKDQLLKIKEDYDRLRQGITDEKELRRLNAAEKSDKLDVEHLRDLLRGTRIEAPIETNYARMSRVVNQLNYARSMGEMVLASITDAVRPAMVHGLGQFMADLPKFLTAREAVKMSVGEAQLAGNVLERVLGTRLATVSEIIDPYTVRSPFEKLMENMTNAASKWNGIRMWTDMMKSVAAVMTQNRILANVEAFAKAPAKERQYLAFLGIDQSMAERIAAQFSAHGETIDGVRVANTSAWEDAVAVRAYRAAMNKDVNSIIVERSVGDVPLFAHTPMGRMLLQFKSFALASHQKVLLRGLQEDQTRFVGGLIAMTAMGMLITYLKSVTGNRPEARTKMMENPGWWIGEGLDRAGVFSVPVEVSNMIEKAVGVNPIKSPMKAFDKGDSVSQKNQNRNELGSLLGPGAGLVQDALRVAAIPAKVAAGGDVGKGDKTAIKNVIPFNSYMGARQLLNYVVFPPE